MTEQPRVARGPRARIDAFFGWMEWVLGLCLIVAVALNFSNVISRYVFSTGIFGVDELEVYMVIGAAFLSSAIVMWRDEHLKMDALSTRFPRVVRRPMRRIEHLVVAVVSGFACWQSGVYTWQMAMLDRRSDLMEIPMWVPHGCVFVGLAMITAIAAWRLLAGGRAAAAAYPPGHNPDGSLGGDAA